MLSDLFSPEFDCASQITRLCSAHFLVVDRGLCAIAAFAELAADCRASTGWNESSVPTAFIRQPLEPHQQLHLVNDMITFLPINLPERLLFLSGWNGNGKVFPMISVIQQTKKKKVKWMDGGCFSRRCHAGWFYNSPNFSGKLNPLDWLTQRAFFLGQTSRSVGWCSSALSWIQWILKW